MSNEADKYWDDVANELRKKKGLCSLTPEQAQKIANDMPDEELTEDEINDIVETVTSGELMAWAPEPDANTIGNIDTSNINSDVVQLNRNRGESDPETDELLKELRRQALEEEDG